MGSPRKSVVPEGDRIRVITIGIQGPPGVNASFNDTAGGTSTVGLSGGTDGVSNNAARKDHKHQLDTTATDTRYLRRAQNLADLTDPAAARSNLGISGTSDEVNAALATKQPLDSDLTTIAGMAAADDDVLQRKAGAWAHRSPAQLKADLNLAKGDVGLSNADNTADSAKPVSTATQAALNAKQDADADLAQIAGLTAANDDVLQRKAGAWSNRSVGQLKTDLAVTKADVGLGSVPNVDATQRSNHTGVQPISSVTNLQTTLDGKESTANKGVAGGYASLDGSGKVPSSQLPAYVDSIEEYPTLSAFPATGSAGTIYVATDTSKSYRWGGSTYVEMSPSEVTSVAGRTGAVVLTKADVGLSNVPNVDATNRANHTGTQLASSVSDFSTAADQRIFVQKGAAGGLATLGLDAKVPLAQLPSTLNGQTLSRTVNQTAHGLAVGNVVRHDGTKFVKSVATDATGAEVYGLVSTVADVDNFTLTTGGYVSGLTGLTPGATYFLSATVAGALTQTEPTDTGQVSKPVLDADSTSSGYFYNWRGIVLGGGVVDANATTKGVIQLAGDLAGTAAAPTTKARAVSTTVGPAGSTADYVCDGTADEVEVNAAIAALSAAGGGTVLVRAGVYLQAASIRPKSNVELVGEGQASTIFRQPANAGFHAFVISNVQNAAFRRFQIDGNKGASTVSGTHLMRLDTNIQNVTFEDLYIHDGVQHGIIFDHTTGPHTNITVNRVRAANMGIAGLGSGSGFYMLFCVDLKMSNITSTGHVLDGIQWGDLPGPADKINLSNIYVANNGRYGVYVPSGHASITNLGATGNQIGVLVEQNATMNLSGAEVYANQTDGVRINASNGSTISNLRSYNNGQGGGTSAGLRLAAAGVSDTCNRHNITNCLLYDDQGTPTQDFGFWASGGGAVDYNLVSNSQCYGNSSTQFRTDTWGSNNNVNNVVGYGSSSITGNLSVDGSVARQFLVSRSATTNGSNLTIEAGGAQLGGANSAGGSLILTGGVSTGSGRSDVVLKGCPTGPSGTTDNTAQTIATFYGTGNVGIGAASTSVGLLTGMTFIGSSARSIGQQRNSNSNTAGANFTVTSAGATLGATDKSAGTLVLTSGVSTGNGVGSVTISTPTPAGSTGTADNANAVRLTVDSYQVTLNHGIKVKRTTVADVAYTALITDFLIAYTSLTAGRAVTLPSAATLGAGAELIIKDETGTAATNNITVTGTIDGASNKVIDTAYGAVRLYSNGAAWFTSSPASTGNSGGFTGARVFKAANQTLTSGVDTAVAWENETYDSATLHDPTTNNTRITVPATGKYSVKAQVRFQNNGTGVRTVKVRKNGSAVVTTNDNTNPSSTNATTVHVADDVDLAANDYLELVVNQTSGVNLDVLSTGADQQYFAVAKIG